VGPQGFGPAMALNINLLFWRRNIKEEPFF